MTSHPSVTDAAGSAPPAPGGAPRQPAVGSPEQSLVGATLAGRYVIERCIGRGATADVFLARDRLLDRDVAVKVFSSDLEARGLGGRIQAEMRILAKLRHPALVTVFDAGRVSAPEAGTAGDSRPFLVMEFVRGHSLAARLRNGALPGPTVAGIGASVAAALDCIHGQGIVHADVKPSNILLDDDLSAAPARLADFGIAQSVTTDTPADAPTVATGLLGTVGYLSPEQVTGAPLGPPTDVYALGVVLLEALTDTRTFPGGDLTAAAARLEQDPVLDEAPDERWRALLRAMTSREPARRPTARQVSDALRALGAAAPSRAVQAGGAEVRDDEPTTVLPSLDGVPADRTRILDAPAMSDVGSGGAVAAGPAPESSDGGSGGAVAAGPAPERPKTLRPPTRLHPVLLPRHRGIAVAAGALAAVGIVIAILAGTGGGPTAPGTSGSTSPNSGQSTASTRPAYPQLPGRLGRDLRRLESAVP